MGSNPTEATAAAKYQHYLGQPFETWVRKFQDIDCRGRDRHRCEEALAGFGEKSIPWLMEALENESYRESAANALACMGPMAFSAIIPLLQSSKPILRKAGVRLLQSL